MKKVFCTLAVALFLLGSLGGANLGGIVTLSGSGGIHPNNHGMNH
jgi:hypothetical protein